MYVVGGTEDAGDTVLSAVSRFDGASWSQAPPMNAQRMLPAAAVLGPYLVVTGGWDGSQALASGEKYDGNSWSPILDMNFPRYGHALAATDVVLYAVGGFDSGGVGALRTAEMYTEGVWATIASMAQARFSFGAAVTPDDGSLVVAGGRDETGLALSSAESFDGKTWSALPSLQTARWGFGFVYYGYGQVVAIGGTTTGGSVIGDVEVLVGTVWVSNASLPLADTGMSASMLNSNIYVTGGAIANGTLSARVFRSFQGDWSTLPGSASMPTALKWHASVTYQAPDRSLLYAVGGIQSGVVQNVVEAFDGKTWSLAPPLLQARHNHAVATFQGALYALGGSGNHTILSSVEAFDGVSWSLASPMASQRNGLGAAVFQGKLYAVGGNSGAATFLSSVEVYDGSGWSTAPSMTTNRTYHGVAVFQGYLYAIGGHNIALYSLTSVERFDGTR